MTDKNEQEEWRAAEKATFAALRREHMPSPGLEETIIHVLKAKGLVHLSPIFRMWTLPRVAGALAAATLIGALGFGLGKWQNNTPEISSHQPLFVLFLYDGDESPAHEAEQVEEYRGWAMRLSKTGKTVTGEKLKYDGRILRLASGRLEIGALAGEPRNVALGGYFLIAAKNLEEAASVAASCPHLKYGGTIAVREIDPT
ncbi:MAG: YciI family protein [bacterium]